MAQMEKKYDDNFKVVFEAIRALMTPPEKPKKKIGFGSQGTQSKIPKHVGQAATPPAG